MQAYKNFTVEDKYNNLISSEFFRNHSIDDIAIVRTVSDYSVIENLIKGFLIKLEKPPSKSIRINLGNMYKFTDIENISKCFDLIITSKMPLSPRKRWSILLHCDMASKYICNYNNKLNSREVAAPPNRFDVNTYINNGTSMDDAIRIVANHKQIQSESYTIAERSPYKISYWVNKGYNTDNAKKMSVEFSHKNNPKMVHLSKENFKNKHGVNWKTHWDNMISKRSATKIERYGTDINYSRVSAESLKVLIPLYKWAKRNKKCKLHGVTIGSRRCREYFIKTDSNIFFYDYVDLENKIIVEYSSTSWHGKSVDNLSYLSKITKMSNQESMTKDEIKLNVAINAGFTIFTIWSDENIEEQLQEIKDEYNTRR